MNVPQPKPKLPRWVAPVLFFSLATVALLLVLLAFSIMERRWEMTRPALVLKPIAEWEPDNAKWGENYPREYESYLRTKDDTTRTRYGGAQPRDYLDENPRLVTLFAGYGFAKDYKQARGHYHAVTDVTETKRIKTPFNPATCWSCKSPDVPRVMEKMGVKEFYAANFHDLKGEIKNPIGCQDCHDPQTMNLRITRPALREAWARQGKDIDQATHQELRSLVCAQCHVEYYFAKEPKNYLTFPWDKGMSVDDMIAYYDANGFTDWVHAISKTPIIKAQHPDYEVYAQGIHAYRGVACADCHMPYRTEGGVKFTDHHVQSPLLNIAGSCAVCHRWSEDEIRERVESIQRKVEEARTAVEDALVKTHFEIAAAIEAGFSDAELAPARELTRHAQFRWDYVAANNGVGFHAPHECLRILTESLAESGEARVQLARLLARKGISVAPSYPDTSTRAAAWAVDEAYVAGKPAPLLAPPAPAPATDTDSATE